jgi:DNA-binding PadR family transcriptional regulator
MNNARHVIMLLLMGWIKQWGSSCVEWRSASSDAPPPVPPPFQERATAFYGEYIKMVRRLLAINPKGSETAVRRRVHKVASDFWKKWIDDLRQWACDDESDALIYNEQWWQFMVYSSYCTEDGRAELNSIVRQWDEHHEAPQSAAMIAQVKRIKEISDHMQHVWGSSSSPEYRNAAMTVICNAFIHNKVVKRPLQSTAEAPTPKKKRRVSDKAQ